MPAIRATRWKARSRAWSLADNHAPGAGARRIRCSHNGDHCPSSVQTCVRWKRGISSVWFSWKSWPFPERPQQ